jgi:hypothetical protein
LRPARLPIPPSGLDSFEIGCKGTTKNANTQIFLEKNAFYLFFIRGKRGFCRKKAIIARYNGLDCCTDNVKLIGE